MRGTTIMLALIFSIAGCNRGSKDPTTSDTVVDTGAITDTAADEPFVSSFTTGGFRFGQLTLVAETDVDGDGVIDNNLPNALLAVDLLLPSEDLSPEGFNANLQANLDSWVTNILLQAVHDGRGGLSMGFMQAQADANFNLQVAAHDVDVNGDAKQRLDGHFLSETAFDVGPGDLLVPITFFSGGSPLPVTLGDTHLYGDLQAEGGDGVLVGGLPLDALIDKVVAPLVPDNYDINGDGVPETKAEIMELIWSIAPLSADIQLSDGTDAISARFIWTASPATWVVK